MSQAPSTLGTMITLSLSPISPTSCSRSSSSQGLSSELTRVQSEVVPKSEFLAASISPARAASLRSTGIASSRLPSRMSVCCAMAAALATIFGFEKSRKWIIRDGVTGISRSGSGAPIACGWKKSLGCLKCPPAVFLARGIYSRGPEGRRALAPRPALQRHEAEAPEQPFVGGGQRVDPEQGFERLTIPGAEAAIADLTVADGRVAAEEGEDRRFGPVDGPVVDPVEFLFRPDLRRALVLEFAEAEPAQGGGVEEARAAGRHPVREGDADVALAPDLDRGEVVVMDPGRLDDPLDLRHRPL